jgi:Tfp pilus assembly protein FimT
MAGPARGQFDSRSPSRSSTSDDRVTDLERTVAKLESRIDALAADLADARAEAVEARQAATAAAADAEVARGASDELREWVENLTAGITIDGDVLTVRQLNAEMVVTEEIDAETYHPGAGNVW